MTNPDYNLLISLARSASAPTAEGHNAFIALLQKLKKNGLKLSDIFEAGITKPSGPSPEASDLAAALEANAALAELVEFLDTDRHELIDALQRLVPDAQLGDALEHLRRVNRSQRMSEEESLHTLGVCFEILKHRMPALSVEALETLIWYLSPIPEAHSRLMTSFTAAVDEKQNAERVAQFLTRLFSSVVTPDSKPLEVRSIFDPDHQSFGPVHAIGVSRKVGDYKSAHTTTLLYKGKITVIEAEFVEDRSYGTEKTVLSSRISLDKHGRLMIFSGGLRGESYRQASWGLIRHDVYSHHKLTGDGISKAVRAMTNELQIPLDWLGTGLDEAAQNCVRPAAGAADPHI